ncbi:MAG: polyphosphate kinase 2 family protein [Deltaproteobacteria bacterium]|nr:MAG: polyphosphate kinase 2 family protein [Deltaproteobacteria bacterium]
MSLPEPPVVHVNSPYVVPFDGSFSVEDAATGPTAPLSKKELKKELCRLQDQLSDLQRVLYAHDHHSVLLVFQAMDAAGKDGTVRAVMSGVNPAGCQVHSFKKPSSEDLDHDFLWRTAKRLPERGRIGIFNRSYYEEVLVVRVHPEYLGYQRLPYNDPDHIWEERLHSIREHEAHLARNGTLILKFWLNVSHAEQKARFLSRLDEPEKNWKFAVGDVQERQHWPKYMQAYEHALNATSRPWAPWLAIPADNKPYMRVKVAQAIVSALESLDMHYPEVSPAEASRFAEMRALLDSE